MADKLASSQRRYRPAAIQMEAAARWGLIILVLNIFAVSISLADFCIERKLTSLGDRGRIPICAGGQMLLVGPDGDIIEDDPAERQTQHHDCPCCYLLQAGTELPQTVPIPAGLAAIQIMRPGSDDHLRATSLPAQRSRGPPTGA